MINKIILFFALLMSISFYGQTVIIPSGSNWNFLDDGSNQGTAWQELAFDDSSWNLNLPAEFGYGDTPRTFVSYGPDAQNKHVTTYFRKTFTVENVSQYERFLLEARRDDGMVVYLNGEKVWSDNMPENYNYTTYAQPVSGYNESDWVSKKIVNNLVEGQNVIAVEIHQRSASSSDIRFDLRLSDYIIEVEEEIFDDGSKWNYLDNGTNQGTAWRALNFNDASWKQNERAEFGYEDSLTTTSPETKVEYGGDIENKFVTTYFRKTFNVDTPSFYDRLKLKARRDDGMVVYLNNEKIWSDNMPATYNYNTFAVIPDGGYNPSSWIYKTINNSLVEGLNVLAVEIHQASAASVDMRFDFKLEAVTDPNLETIQTVRGPYLQTGTPTSVIVKWSTNIETPSIINYGTALGNLNSIKQDNTLKTEHEIELTGLLPNTKYYYKLSNATGVYEPESNTAFVKTAPNVAENQFVRAWILGDAGTANQNQRLVRDQYYNYVNNTDKNPDQTDMMLFLGDNAYNSGKQDEYQEAFFDIYSDMLKKSVAWSTLGNHDGYTANSTQQSGPYYDIFSFPKAGESGGVPSSTEAYYSFDYANIHFIVLESYTLHEDSTQLAWCLQDIQATSQDWIVAIFHHPAYTKGSHDSDSERQLISMRENFLPILESNGVDLVLSGHSHSYERSYFINNHYGLSDTFDTTSHIVNNGIESGRVDENRAYLKQMDSAEGAVYITTGSAGKISSMKGRHAAMFSSLKELGSCVLEVEENTEDGQDLHVKFINDEGAISDYFTITKKQELLSNKDVEIKTDTLKIHPVPATSIINIEVPVNEILESVKIYSITGVLVKETTTTKIDVSKITTGSYMFEVKTDKETTYRTVIIE